MNTPTASRRTSRVVEVDRLGWTPRVTPYTRCAARSFVLAPRNAPILAARRRHVLGPSQPMRNLEIAGQQRCLPAFATDATPGALDELALRAGQQVCIGQQVD